MNKSTYSKRAATLFVSAVLILNALQSSAQELYPVKLPDSLWHNQQRELRYQPDGEGFVIVNGKRLFTRALYGTNTAFRIETGDRPEFSLYMPGMGGNFKLGIEADGKSRWLTEAQTITARYNAGSMTYIIQDPIIGNAKLRVEILALGDAEGFIVKINFTDLAKAANLFCAFGGATGKKFSRDGDMGPDPESNFYLKPENCKDNNFELADEKFTLKYGAGLQVGPDGRYFEEDLNQQSQTSKEQILVGTFPTVASLKLADASKLSSPLEYYQSSVIKSPALAARLKAANNTNYFFSIHNPAGKAAFNYSEAPAIFLQAETRRKQIADRITIKTPDPFINTIGGTLAIASDATWEAPSYLHGSIGWRMRLNGWRGAYTADDLGWHDRAKTHLESYLQSQVLNPATGPVVANTATHLSRSLEKLGAGMFSKGYISRDPLGKSLRAHHYDMNLVFFDILLRHYAWTGDLTFLKKTWPALKNQLEWETWNFDADRDGLYDAYAAIWASDALQYSGGGVAHASAYNHYAYKKAAEIAALLGEDPAPYHKEADKILKAMNDVLWIPKKGTYAEFKDLLGNKLLHPSAALWTIYHSMDSETLDPFQAYLSMRYVDTEIPHIPVRAKGLEDQGYYTISTTNWMPYTWSLNNVAMAESMHTILANWQAGRADEAFKLFKSEILASMYLGGSPGNIVQISQYDAVRAEAYRDFGDPVGMFSRALVEGLFGIVPDALHKTFTVRPGLPTNWNFTSFSTPDISFDFKRSGKTDTYTLVPKFPTALRLKFQALAQGQVKSILVNGKPASWKNISSSISRPAIEIISAPAVKYTIQISWEGAKPALPFGEKTYVNGSRLAENVAGAKVIKIYDPQQVLTGIKTNAGGFTARVNAQIGSYTVFAQVSQGALSWWMPVCFHVENRVTVLSKNAQETNTQSFRIQNNSSAEVTASVHVNTFKTALKVAAGKVSEEVTVPENDLLPGTNSISIRLQDGELLKEKLIDWTVTTRGRMEQVDMNNFYNDKVTQIFRNKYLSPRPTVTTLQLPWQGTGDWPHPLETHDIDDSGLRKLAGEKNSFSLPQGISFATPGVAGKNNILFTSQWDNYPHEATLPLSGQSSHAWFLMAGSTNPMQSQLDNGLIVIEYIDGTSDTLALRNPETWWPIEEDYYTDGFAFSLKQPRPIRIHLKTGNTVTGEESKSRYNGREISGGAATILDLLLDASKTLKSLTLKTLANDVVIGLMAVTLHR